jgi:glycosyltransferase involved in cell wall biosynthesis
MRILIAHEAAAGGGGVESYLASIMPALIARGHQLAFLHHNSRNAAGPTRLDAAGLPTASVADEGLEAAVSTMRRFDPEVCFSHNMRQLEVDERVSAEWPTIKMMHGYFGTCIGGQKAHAFPSFKACGRTFGAPCLALYVPRHCGQLRPLTMVGQFAWALRQQRLFDKYSSVVVASEHMAREYARHGIEADRLTVAPLFPTVPAAEAPRPLPSRPTVLFAGRITSLKGGHVLVRAAAAANQSMREPLQLLVAGEGPALAEWRALAERLGVHAEFTGWVSGDERTEVFRRASLVALPSLWPEPFGLVGLEAAAHGVPAVAFDVGGIREWLRPDVNGRLVSQAGDAAALGAALASLFESQADLRRLGEGAMRVARELTLDAHLDTLERVFMRAVQSGRVLA